MLALREPSLGPVFGVKGGAAGGGYAQVVPMEDINLHFTGDMHAITAANNLLSALVDAHRFHRHEPEIATVTWRRAIDVTDRQLRNIVGGLGGAKNGIPAESGFDITAASEVMAILALATDLPDLRRKLGAITVGYTPAGDPVTAEEIKAAGAMAVLLKDALKPNIVQTLEGQLCFMHAGPFANIAHGNNSIIADRDRAQAGRVRDHRVGLRRRPRDGEVHGHRLPRRRLAAARRRDRRDGAGAAPSRRRRLAREGRARADGGRGRDGDGEPRQAHRERARVRDPAGRRDQHAPGRRAGAARADQGRARSRPVRSAPRSTTASAQGGEGTTELAEVVAAAAEADSDFHFLYEDDEPIATKIEKIATTVYGADGIDLAPAALEAIARYEKQGLAHLPICMAKTHLSLSHDPLLRNRPQGFVVPIRDIRVYSGAGMLVPLCGDMLQMPGLGAQPAAFAIDIDENGETVGLLLASASRAIGEANLRSRDSHPDGERRLRSAR